MTTSKTESGARDAAWQAKFEALLRFRAQHRHCNVPAKWAEDPSLGRWVAAQRYRQGTGELCENKFRALNAIGFVWHPTDIIWETHFRKLLAFQRLYGHCNVPRNDPHHGPLGVWVQNQRQAHSKGSLPSQRQQLLQEICFCWKLRSTDSLTTQRSTPRPVAAERLGRLPVKGRRRS